MTMNPPYELEGKSEDTAFPPSPVQAPEGDVRAWCTMVGG